MLVIFGLPIKPTKGTTNASRAAPVAPEARISTQQALYVRAFNKKSSHGRIEEGSGERGLAAKAAKAERRADSISNLDLLDPTDPVFFLSSDLSAGPRLVGRGLRRALPRRRAHGHPQICDPSLAPCSRRREAQAGEGEPRRDDSELSECRALRVKNVKKAKVSLHSSSFPLPFRLFLQDVPAS